MVAAVDSNTQCLQLMLTKLGAFEGEAHGILDKRTKMAALVTVQKSGIAFPVGLNDLWTESNTLNLIQIISKQHPTTHGTCDVFKLTSQWPKEQLSR